MRSAAASQRRLRTDSRQSAATPRSRTNVHLRTSDRLSARSQPAADPLVDLMRSVFDNQRADADRREMQIRHDMRQQMQTEVENARLQMELAQLKRNMAAERQTTAQLLLPAAIEQERPGSVGKRDGRAEFVRAAELILDSHTQPLVTVDSVNLCIASTLAQSAATARGAHSLSAPDSPTLDNPVYPPALAPADSQHASAEMRSLLPALGLMTSIDSHVHPPLLPGTQDSVIYTAAGLIQSTATASERAAVKMTDYACVSATVSYPKTRSVSNSHIYPPPPDSVRAVPGLTVDYAHRQLTGSLVADNTLMSGRAALPVFGTIDSYSVDNNTLSVHIDRQLIGNNPDVDNYLYPPPTAPYLGMSSAAATDHVRPPPPLQVNSGHALPGTFGPIVQQQLTDSRGMENVSMNDRALPIMTSDMTAAAIPPQTLMSTGDERLQFSLQCTPFCATTPPVCHSERTVSTDLSTVNCSEFISDALHAVNSFQSAVVMNGSRNSVVPLYTVPSVTAVMSTAVHLSHSSFSNMGAHQASSGAFLTHTPRGPMISFPLGTYSGWGSALNAEYLNPDFVLPTPVMGGPLTPMVDPVLTLPSTVPTASLLPLLTDTTSTITTAATDSVTDSVFGKLAAGLQILPLAPRSSGVTIHPDGQALSVPAAATPAVQPFTATTSVTIQQPGSATTVTTAASTSTAATFVVPTALSESTTASSAVATTSATTVAAFNALPVSTAITSAVEALLPLITSTVASSSSDTGVAVSVSSGLNPPGSTYVTSTQSVTPPVIVVYSQDILKRYDGSTSPKEFMEHFDIIADVNGRRTELDKLKHLKAALDGRAAYRLKILTSLILLKRLLHYVVDC